MKMTTRSLILHLIVLLLLILCLRLEVSIIAGRLILGGGKQHDDGGVSVGGSSSSSTTTGSSVHNFRKDRRVVSRKMSDDISDEGDSITTTNNTPQSSPPKPQTKKNVILLIADGCDASIVSLARRYKQYDDTMTSATDGNDDKSSSSNNGNNQIFLDTLQQTARIRPMMTSNDENVGVIADSASTATAFATGKLTTNNFISVVGPSSSQRANEEDSEEENSPSPYSPIPTVLEIAKGYRMKTGIVATSTVSHATTGAFGCHVDDRRKEQEMTKQLVHQNIDVVMGGGHAYLTTPQICGSGAITSGGDECVDLDSILQEDDEEDEERGYQMCYNKAEMDALDLTTNGTTSSSSSSSNRRVWCSFADYAMLPELDRQRLQQQPSLAEMTSKAIEILSSTSNENNQDDDNHGFVLVVEGSQIDWAAHGNDPIWMVTDFIAWDDAVKVAVEFAAQREDTAVIALSDHNTGGVSIGNIRTSSSYPQVTLNDLIGPLKGMTMTSQALSKILEEEARASSTALTETVPVVTSDMVVDAISRYWNINITAVDAQDILSYNDPKNNFSGVATNYPLWYAIGRIVSERYTVVGWTTHGHTGDDVPMYTYGIPNSLLPNIGGLMMNNEVGSMIQQLIYGDRVTRPDQQLESIDEVIATNLFMDVDRSNLKWYVNLTDPLDPHAVVEDKFKFPFNTDYFYDLGAMTHNTSSTEGGDEDSIVSRRIAKIKTVGLTIYAPMTKKLYISKHAIEIVNKYPVQ